ncbi:MAG: hypothetical protein RIT04_580, partial [Candidatus Parcubacteria bacterium]
MDVITSSILYISLFGGLYYQVFLLVTFFEVDEKEPEKIADADLPTVSITVPCFNEGKTLSRTVRSLLNINYPADKLSILIVDDGSTDDTHAVAKTFESDRVRVIHQKNQGKYTALNLGIMSSKAEFIGCLDADSTVHPDALRKMLAYFKTDNIMSVTPALHVYKPSNILQLMQRVEYNVGIFAKRIFGKMNAIHVTPGPFSIFRRSVFETIGLFKHAHNTEDMEIAFRIQMHGYR